MEEEVKCPKCGKQASMVTHKEKRIPCWVCHDCRKFISWVPEVYSRTVGYLRPVDKWHKGKQQEWKDRIPYKMPKECKTKDEEKCI